MNLEIGSVVRLGALVGIIGIAVAAPVEAAPQPLEPKGSTSSGNVTFRWKAQNDATHYLIRVRRSDNSKAEASKRKSSNFDCGGGGTCRYTVRLSGGSYKWDVKGFNRSRSLGVSRSIGFSVSGGPSNNSGSSGESGDNNSGGSGGSNSGGNSGSGPLLSPAGATSDKTPTFEWKTIGNATHYILRVNDGSGRKQKATRRTAGSMGCGDGTCSFNLGSFSNGNYEWRITPQTNGRNSQSTNYVDFSIGSSNGSSGGDGNSDAGGSNNDNSGKGSGSGPLLSPAGATSDKTPTFEWKTIGNATHYILRVNDSSGRKQKATRRTAGSMGCGDGTCNFNLGNFSNGDYEWRITPQTNGRNSQSTEYVEFSIGSGSGTSEGGGNSGDGGSNDNQSAGESSGSSDGDSFKRGNRVVAAARVSVRNNASFGSGVKGYAPEAHLGSIDQGPKSSGGNRWWRVNFESGPDGWVTENDLDHPYFPGSGNWRSLVDRNATPSGSQKSEIRNKAGIDWDKMNQAFNYSKGFAGDSTVVVIRNGYLAFHKGHNNRYLIASATKSMTGLTLMGACQRHSDLCPNRKLYPNMPGNWGNDDGRKKQITIEQTMAMASGLQPHDQPGTSNYLNVILNRDMKTSPAREWSYASLPMEMLSMIMQERTGKRLSQLFKEYFGNAMGISSVPWGRVGKYDKGSSKAEFRATDLAKVVYMVMMEGAWKSGNGQRQLLSASRARDLCTRPGFLGGAKFYRTPNSPFPVDGDSQRYYGLTWWMNSTGKALGSPVPRDACYAHGFKETLAIAIPSKNMVVIRFGSQPKANAAFKRQFMSRVMRAVH